MARKNALPDSDEYHAHTSPSLIQKCSRIKRTERTTSILNVYIFLLRAKSVKIEKVTDEKKKFVSYI